MSDQGRWFKLWTTADDDPALANLSLADFARWCLFGIYLKKHGRDGRVTLTEPSTALCARFRVPGFADCLAVLRSFPNCDVVTEDVTGDAVTVTVTWRNWKRFQEDNSAARTRAWRMRQRRRDGVCDDGVTGRETPKEEKRREENPPVVPRTRGTRSRDGPVGFDAFWAAYPWHLARAAAERAWLKLNPDLPLHEHLLDAIAWQRRVGCLAPRVGPDGRPIRLHPASWLNGRRWEDERPSELVTADARAALEAQCEQLRRDQGGFVWDGPTPVGLVDAKRRRLIP